MKKKNEGVVLVFVVIFTLAISSLAIFLSAKSKQYLEVFTGIEKIIERENMAEMGMEMGKVLLDIAQKKHIISDTPGCITRHYEIGDKKIDIVIEDENGRINPNAIFGPERGKVNTKLLEVYKRFFSVMGYSEYLSDALLDWIDEDDIPRQAGAEASFYRATELPYLPANRPLYTPEEMLFVVNFTEDIVYGNDEKVGLINFITCFSDGKINVNSCRPEILSALGFSTAEVEKITEERARRPIEERFLQGVNKEAYLRYRDIITFKSSYFTISSCVTDGDGFKRQTRGYVKKTDKETKIVRMEIR